MYRGIITDGSEMKLITYLTVLFITQAALQQGIYSQLSCDENQISESGEARKTAENSLLNARSVNVTLPSGIDITAFYCEGKLIKISTTDNLSHCEQIFFEKENLRCFESSGYDNGKEYFIAYYIKDDKVFCKQNMLSGAFLELGNNESKGIIMKVQDYLLAIQ